MTLDMIIGLSPLLIVAGGALALMLVEALSKLRHEHLGSPSAGLALVSAIVCFSAMLASVGVWLAGPETIPDLARLVPYLAIDRFSVFFFALLTLSAGLVCLLAGGYLPEHRLDHGEFYPLMLLSTVGAMVLAASTDLITVFVSLEIMSLGVYAMIAFRKGSLRAIEAGVKYFLLGSFAAAILLYGGALLYGATGHTDLVGIGRQIGLAAAGLSGPAQSASDWALLATRDMFPLVVIGAVLMLVGLAFKVSAVPFHGWTPDAYEGAATPVTAFMAVAVKAAAFALALRVVLLALSAAGLDSWGTGWPPVVAGLAVLTMSVANVIAVCQQSVKRMLAYSSIAHAGYLLMAMVALARQPAETQAAMLLYLLVYALSTVGAFAALIWCGSRGVEAVSYADLEGLGRRHPAVAFLFSVFLLSLAGVPPLAGFMGKFYLFKVTIDNGLIALAVVGLLNSVVAAYYYLRVMVAMYMKEPSPKAPQAVPMSSGLVIATTVIAALLVIVVGLVPSLALPFVGMFPR